MDDTPHTDAVTYELTLKGGGISVAREIPESTALEILAAVMGGGQGAGGSRVAFKRRDLGAPPGGSLREYFDEVAPKRNVDKILAIASYLETAKDFETFSKDEVRKQFRAAGEPVPGNYARDFRWAVSAGWVAPAEDEPGEFYVTEKGRSAVAAKFSDEVKKATGVGRAIRPRRTRKKGSDA